MCIRDRWRSSGRDTAPPKLVSNPGLPAPSPARPRSPPECRPPVLKQLSLGQVAYIPGENEALQGLAQVNRDLIQVLGERCPDQKIATVDQDATIIESRKREAKPTYEGERGYQPMLAVWAETGVVLADEFR